VSRAHAAVSSKDAAPHTERHGVCVRVNPCPGALQALTCPPLCPRSINRAGTRTSPYDRYVVNMPRSEK
jgi:hypothetical protein